MKILVDNQLPAPLARFLAARGHDSRHVLDIGMEGSSDLEIWAYANQNKCVIFSKDEDFLHLANARASEASFVWIRLGNCRTKTLLDAVALIWPSIEEELNSGERIVEIR